MSAPSPTPSPTPPTKRRRGRPTPAFTLSRSDERQLRRWARGAGVPAALAERARFIVDCAAGDSRAEVARRYATSAHRVGRWCRRFQQHGPDGLIAAERNGAAPVLGEGALSSLLAHIDAGVSSTHGLARACGISQPTASRIRRMLGLHPTYRQRLPPALRLIDDTPRHVVGIHIGIGVRVLMLGPYEASPTATPTAAALAPPLPAAATLAPAIAAARRAAVASRRRQRGLKLRRFLRDMLRSHIDMSLVAIASTRGRPGPAVTRLLAKQPLLTWHTLATDNNWLRLARAWLTPPLIAEGPSSQ